MATHDGSADHPICQLEAIGVTGAAVCGVAKGEDTVLGRPIHSQVGLDGVGTGNIKTTETMRSAGGLRMDKDGYSFSLSPRGY